MSSIGDIILTTPLVRCIKARFPQAELHFLIKKEFYAVMENNPHINKFWIYDKATGFDGFKQIKQEILSQKYDWLIDIHRNLRTSFLKRNTGIPLITTYSKKIFQRTLLVYLGINLYKENKLVVDRYFEAVEKFGIQNDNKGTEVFFKEEDLLAAKELLKKEEISEHFIVICPAASFKNKQWLPERFAEVADNLISTYKKKIVLLGGKNDVLLCEEIRKMMKEKAGNMAGKCKLTESAAMLSLSDLAITNDSGMMHLAQSQKRPVVALFGPTTRELGYYPLPQNSVAMETNEKCRPCTHNGLNHCPKKHFNCMKNITVEQVLEACGKFL